MFTYNIKQLPFVSMTGRSREKVGWSHSGRSMPINLLTIIHKGECVFRINETEYRLKAGNAVIVPKDTLYTPHTDNFCEYTFFHFDGDFTECDAAGEYYDMTGGTSDNKSIYGYMEQQSTALALDYKINIKDKMQEIELLLNKCVNTRANHASRQQILLSVHLCEIMYHLSEAFFEQRPKENSYPQTLNKILYYIKENYTSNIRLDDICKHASISKQYCMRLFKKHMNTTINDYILELRMKHAAYLLRHTYMNVNQAADYLGFSSVSYFSRVFKSYYGVTPSAYFE